MPSSGFRMGNIAKGAIEAFFAGTGLESPLPESDPNALHYLLMDGGLEEIRDIIATAEEDNDEVWGNDDSFFDLASLRIRKWADDLLKKQAEDLY